MISLRPATAVPGAGSAKAAARSERGRRPSRPKLGLAPLLALLAALGLLLVALGDDAARLDRGGAQPLFWGGLILIYAPIALRLFSASASREERLVLSILLGGVLYGVKVVYEPNSFTLHDELATWRQTSDLIASGHPFSPNPLVSGYAGFPGLELLSAALSRLGGLSIFLSGTIVVALARLSLSLALFVFLERATRSARAAGIGVALYACNPSFLYFDSQFGYESLAVAIAAALLLATQSWSAAGAAQRRTYSTGLVWAMAVLAATLAITHHMTAYALIAFLGLWALTTAYARKGTAGSPAVLATHGPAPVAGAAANGAPAGANGRAGRSLRPRPPAAWFEGPALPALFLVVASAAWFALEAGHVTVAELGGVFEEAFESALNFITGESGSKTLFQSASQTNTTAARIVGVASIVPLLALIPPGLLRTWRRPRRPDPLWQALAAVAALYPLTMLLRLTAAGTETSQRASAFVYLGLAFLGGLLLAELPWRGGRPRRLSMALGLTALFTVMFLGGFIIGESPVTRLPGPYLVGGEARAISPQGVAAAQFASKKLPPGSRVLSDRPNSTLLSSYGHLDRVSGSIEGIPVSRVFNSRRFDAIDQRVISNDAIDYIVVDRRLSHEVPAGGFYFESTEPRANSYEQPIEVIALRKFNHVRGLSLIFDNGAIAIYDTAGLRSR